ncbi:MAG TPA: hypothetical protein V6C97_14255 [Oculatellaceae cyanobacterium]
MAHPRPAHYASEYSKDDIAACLCLAQSEGIKNGPASERYFKETGIRVPATTLNYRAKKLLNSSVEGTYVYQNPKALLTPDQRVELRDWILANSHTMNSLHKYV